MAQVKPFTWYADQDAVGVPGMKADTAVDVVDSFAAEAGINPGEVVIHGTNADQVKAAATATDGAKGIGIALHVHREPASGKYYEAGYEVPVLTSGDVYVKAGGDVTAGDKADIAIGDDGEMTFTKTGGTNTVPGVTFLDAGTKGDIVRVRVRL